MIEFDRPWALASLLVPLLVTILALQARRAPRASTGTLELWKQVPPEAARAPVRRSSPPWALLLLVAALCAGSLALAGARAPAQSSPRWIVLLDRSPSMYASCGGASVLERALESLDAQLVGAREFRCVAGQFVSAPEPLVPQSWLARPAGDWDEPEWERLDTPGSVWVTDSPSKSPLHASVLRVGCGQSAGLELAARKGLFVDARLEGTAFGQLALSWSEARGVARLPAPQEALLSIVVAGDGPSRSVRCAGRGWSLEGAARAFSPVFDEPVEVWLACEGESVVRARPGRIEVAWDGAPKLAGDDLEFALEISRRLDRACVASIDAPGSGPTEFRSGEPPLPEAPTRSYVPWLATLAAALAFGSLAARR